MVGSAPRLKDIQHLQRLLNSHPCTIAGAAARAPLHPLRAIFDVADSLVCEVQKHFTNDLGADLFDRVELMLAIEDQFAGVEITDDDVEQIQVVGDLIRHVNTKQVKR
jgi:acyl carrier protein